MIHVNQLLIFFFQYDVNCKLIIIFVCRICSFMYSNLFCSLFFLFFFLNKSFVELTHLLIKCNVHYAELSLFNQRFIMHVFSNTQRLKSVLKIVFIQVKTSSSGSESYTRISIIIQTNRKKG